MPSMKDILDAHKMLASEFATTTKLNTASEKRDDGAEPPVFLC